MVSPLRKLKRLVQARGPWLAKKYPAAADEIVGLAVVYFWPELTSKSRTRRKHSKQTISAIVGQGPTSYWLVYVMVELIVRWLIARSKTRAISEKIKAARRR